MPAPMPTLSVRNLRTWFHTRAGIVRAVDDVSFDVHPGEIVGLVGESGSGKSITGFSVLGLIDPPGRIDSGQVLFKGTDLATLSREQLRQLRGNRIAMVFQDPMMTLNPVFRIETQMVETIRSHERCSHKAAWARSRDALAAVGIPSPEERLKAYPHQLSGGMRQRVAIAIAILHKPDLIIADEPTTALDVTIQAQILAEMQKLCADTGTAMVWVSHDLAVIAGLADRVCVMYAGRIVESGPTDDILDRPRHPYTVGLIGSVPSNARTGPRLYQIPGMAPSPLSLPAGCAFHPRCGHATDRCRAEQPAIETDGARAYRCFHPRPGDDS
ncbi:ABC transporter ATP-binding protein [Achromobacter aloeverae]|uniref:Methionine ABC transporter ATP-binding protein n=1 Tax=Achromobacter aloeverae TaxID=1750518 RepID=A0A4Q1HH34_9BURK|nr:ABC transporter ATP-binding protein [Achromobacter aloeverae]RXN85467.1 methionine ABC transporter ATP-binding protein [Achromobacter aloeverae]